MHNFVVGTGMEFQGIGICNQEGIGQASGMGKAWCVDVVCTHES